MYHPFNQKGGLLGLGPKEESRMRFDAFLQGLGGLGSRLIAGGAPTTDPSARGRGWGAGGQAFMQNYQGALGRARQQRLAELKYGQEQAAHAQRLKQQGRTERAAEDYAKMLEGKGRGDLANLIRANPAEWLKSQFQINAKLATRKDRDDWLAVPGLGVYHIPSGRMITQYSQTPSAGAPGAQPAPPGSAPLPTAPPAAVPGTIPSVVPEVPRANVSPHAPRMEVPSSLRARAETQKGRAQSAYNRALAVVEKDEQRIVASRGIENALTRFGNLLTKQEKQGEGTGGIWRKIPGVVGAESQFDPEIASMQAISDEITPLMRQGMPGAASDRDVAMFRGATVSVDKLPEVNRNIIRAKKAQLKRDGEYTRAKRAWVEQYKTLGGFEDEWRDFANANPIFADPELAGDYELNPERTEYSVDWRRKMKERAPSGDDITIKKMPTALGGG